MCEKSAENYDKLNQFIEFRPATKYPRTPGYRPPPEENPYNAWLVKPQHHSNIMYANN